jgi:hypothetical protein
MKIFQIKVVGKIKTHTLCSITLFQNHAIYEIMWKNIVQPGRPQMTIGHMQIACWIPQATNMQSDYEILIDLPQQQWLHEHASSLHYTYIH